MLKVALIGTGGISQSHISAWGHIPEAKLVSVCDIRPEKVDPVAEKTGATAYYSLDDMLTGEPFDILDICLPTYLHADYAVRALSRGIHVLMEKPISLHEEDVMRVYDTAKAQGVRVMVAQVLRFWPEYIALKEAVDTGIYGALLSGTMTRLGNTPRWSWDNWMTDPRRSGLVPFDLHIHDLDFLVHMLGAPKGVFCKRARTDRQDDLHAIYDYGDVFVSTEAAWYDGEYTFQAGYRFQFDRALMEYKDGALTIFHKDGRIETAAQDDAEDDNGINLPKSNAYYNEIRYFTDCVLAGEDCDRVRPQELIEVLRCIEKLDV